MISLERRDYNVTYIKTDITSLRVLFTADFQEPLIYSSIDDNEEANERRYISRNERENERTMESVSSLRRNIITLALERKRMFNKSLRDTEYAIAFDVVVRA